MEPESVWEPNFGMLIGNAGGIHSLGLGLMVSKDEGVLGDRKRVDTFHITLVK